MAAATTFRMEQVSEDRIHSSDLQYELEHGVSTGILTEGRECYRVHLDGQAEQAEVVFYPLERRGGIANGADAVWTDADNAEEVVQRYIDGEMSN